MLFRGDMAPLFRPGLRKNFRDEFDAFPEEYSQFLKVGTTDLPEIKGMIVAGLNRLYERGDGEPYTYDRPAASNVFIATVKEFAGAFIITRQTIEDDQYAKANQNAKWLGRAAKLTYEYRAADFLNDAFTGTFFPAWDGLSWLNTAHTLVRSSATFANTPSVQVGLSVTGITALLDLAQTQVDQNGDPIRMNPDTLVIGNNAGDWNRALQIWNSQYEPFTAENQENALKLRMKQSNGYMPTKPPIVSRYKSSRKSYFLIDSRHNDAHCDVRIATEFEDSTDFDTSSLKYAARTRFAIYGFDPIGWWGMNPA